MAFWSYPAYVPVAQRRAQAAKKVEKLKKKGRVITPVALEGRKIAQSFWGKAWCDNLERYADFESRLPRGRTYVRNGSVIDLQIARGKIAALVSGSEIYEVEIAVAPTTPERWRAICRDSAGSIASLVELLKGKISKNVMERVCREGDGLFPAPREIKMSCSCPDGANMCKHVAATLYGVGARLDAAPELLFALRGVDSADLISSVDAGATTPRPGALGERILAADDVAALFGIEMSPEPAPAASQSREARKLAKTTKASGGKGVVRDETTKAVREKPVASKAQVSETHEAKSARRRSAAAARTAEPAPVRAAAPSTKRRSARLETAPPTLADAKARTRIEKSTRQQSKKPPQAGALIAEPATTSKKRFGAGPKPVAPATEENALKATAIARNAKSTKPASAPGAAVEQNEPPLRRRGTEPAGRTRATKWISARTRKIRV
jgi:uncharacterized Zn finger protein